MTPARDLAIVLRSIAYEERHKIVTALTESHGLVSAMARNAIQSRRFGGSLDLFAASEWHFTQKPGSDLATLTEAHSRRAFEGLRTDFERLSMASVFNELMLKLAQPGEPCPELFKLHSNALATLDEQKTVGADMALLNAYLAKLLQWSGSQPQLENCLSCGVPTAQLEEHTAVTCLIADAGWVCENCRNDQTHHIRAREGGGLQQSMIRVSAIALRDFQASLSLPIRQVLANTQASAREHTELFRFLEALLAYHLPGFDQKPLKGLRFLGSNPPLQAASPR